MTSYLTGGSTKVQLQLQIAREKPWPSGAPVSKPKTHARLKSSQKCFTPSSRPQYPMIEVPSPMWCESDSTRLRGVWRCDPEVWEQRSVRRDGYVSTEMSRQRPVASRLSTQTRTHCKKLTLGCNKSNSIIQPGLYMKRKSPRVRNFRTSRTMMHRRWELCPCRKVCIW